MDAPDELRQAIMDAIRQADYECEMAESVQQGFASWTEHQADAVLAVPGIADALARDAKVAEIVAKWASGRNEPWPLTVALEVANAIAALYPEAGR